MKLKPLNIILELPNITGAAPTWGEAYYVLDLAYYLNRAGARTSLFADLTGEVPDFWLPRGEKIKKSGKLESLIDSDRFNIFHAYMTAGVLLANEARLPIVSTIHLIAPNVPSYPYAQVNEDILKKVEKGCKHFIFPSEYAKEVFLQLVPAETRKRLNRFSKTICHGVDPNLYKPFGAGRARNALRESLLGVKPEEILVCTVASPERLNGCAGIFYMEVIRAINKEFSNVKFLLVSGKEPQHFIFEPQPVRLAIRSQLKSFGNVDLLLWEDASKKEFHPTRQRGKNLSPYQLADIYFTPYPYETFGYAIAEAMSCGLPVVAPRATAIPEVVGDAGFYIDSYRDLSKPSQQSIDQAVRHLSGLIKHSALRRNVGKKARKRVMENFTITKMVNSTIEFYNLVQMWTKK